MAAADWRSLYPFASRWHDAGGARMHYLDEGPRDDHAVLLVHGNPSWSFLYRDAVRALASRRRCVAPDHVGMGLSDRPPRRSCRLEQRIADLGGLVDALGLRRLDLVLHDWGGPIGLGWARRNPERVGRIALLNTAAFPDPRIPWRIRLCGVPGLGALLVRGANAFAGAAVWMAVRRPLSPAVRAGFLAPYDSWAARRAVHEFVRDIPRAPSHPSYRELMAIHVALAGLRDRPAWIGWGMRDFCFTPHFLRRWREILPGAVVRECAEAGHYVLEDAGIELLPDLAAFLGAR